MDLATKQDFEDRYGQADGRVEPLLEDASALILSEVSGGEADWVTNDGPVPAVVLGICVSVAYRAWSNPDALSSEALGEHTQAWADRSGEALRLTEAERRVLERESGVGSFRSLTLESPYSGSRPESDLNE